MVKKCVFIGKKRCFVSGRLVFICKDRDFIGFDQTFGGIFFVDLLAAMWSLE